MANKKYKNDKRDRKSRFAGFARVFSFLPRVNDISTGNNIGAKKSNCYVR